MSQRRRSFCRYCGALTTNLDSCCPAHRDVLNTELDLIPPDPLVILPTMAEGVHSCQACMGTGTQYPGLECAECDGTGHSAAFRREAATPTKGMED